MNSGNQATLWPLAPPDLSVYDGSAASFRNFLIEPFGRDLSRPSAGKRERPQSPTLICSKASAKVKFQGGPVVHAENCRGLLWVGCRCSWPAADGPLYFTHRNFDAERPVRAGQLSVDAVRWAVLDGHQLTHATGRYRAAEHLVRPRHGCQLTTEHLCGDAAQHFGPGAGAPDNGHQAARPPPASK